MEIVQGWQVQGTNITIVVRNQLHSIGKDHINYDAILEAVKTQTWDDIETLIDPVKSIQAFSQGRVEINGNGEFFWDGAPIHNALTTKMVDMLRDGFTIEPFVNFMTNLMENPSRRAVTELYSFLEKGELPITSDGHFLAYKKVRDDYLDVHSVTISNAVGQVVSMARNQVDDNPANTCSSGLHFCSKDYLQNFGGSRIMILKINPRDVVSIPADYNDTKGRTCRYEVIGELGVDQELKGSVNDTGFDYDDDEPKPSWGYFDEELGGGDDREFGPW
jgi:hypothetical protein